MQNYVHWDRMSTHVHSYIHRCHICQTNKKNKRQYGKLKATNVDLDIDPFEVVAIDIVGPLATVYTDGNEYENILTIIDIKSRCVELIPIRDTTYTTIAAEFDNNWLNRFQDLLFGMRWKRF